MPGSPVRHPPRPPSYHYGGRYRPAPKINSKIVALDDNNNNAHDALRDHQTGEVYFQSGW